MDTNRPSNSITRWPNGNIASKGPKEHPEARDRRVNVRYAIQDLLAEETELEVDGEVKRLTWAQRVARGAVERAANGNVPAAQLVIDQAHGPLKQADDRAPVQVTIAYVTLGADGREVHVNEVSQPRALPAPEDDD